MTTFEALGEQFGTHKKVLSNYLIAVVAVSLVFAAVIAAVTKINNSSNRPVSFDAPVTTQPVIFPAGSRSCLQDCAAAPLQTASPVQPAARAIFQPATDPMGY